MTDPDTGLDKYCEPARAYVERVIDMSRDTTCNLCHATSMAMQRLLHECDMDYEEAARRAVEVRILPERR